MSEKPDFEALRQQRNDSVAAAIRTICEKHGWEPDTIRSTFDPSACYCACADGGPCEHDWRGWREFDDGRGGEQVCSRCGLGAMSHSLRTCE
jgi:hypothetical protein